MGAQEGVHQSAVKAIRLKGVLQGNGKLIHTRGAEGVGLAAHGHHQGVVMKAARLRHNHPLFIMIGCHVNDAGAAINGHHLTNAITEMMPVGLRQVVQLMHIQIHAACGQLMQVRFPKVCAGFFYQGDLRATLFAQGVAQTRDEL